MKIIMAHYETGRHFTKARDERGDHQDIVEALCEGSTAGETSRNLATYREWRRYLERASSEPRQERFLDVGGLLGGYTFE